MDHIIAFMKDGAALRINLMISGHNVIEVINMTFPGEEKDDLLLPQDSDFADEAEEYDTSGEYLYFSSNGMTDNEKIDEYNYYDEYLGYQSSDD